MGKPCRLKVKFKTFLSAQTSADKYMDAIVLTFYPMRAFYCNRHECYHIGHDKYIGRVDKSFEIDVT